MSDGLSLPSHALCIGACDSNAAVLLWQRDVGTAEAMAGHVSLDEVALKYGSADGFSLKDSRDLEVTGQACDALKASGEELSVRISCD